MEEIQLKFINSDNDSAKNEGSKVPKWYGNESDRSTWYKGANLFDYLFWYNMVSGSTNSMYIQYGEDRQGWGSGRFFLQELQIVDQEITANRSLKVTVRSRLRRFRQRKTSHVQAGFNIEYTLKVLGNTVFTYKGNAMDTINESSSEWYTKTFTVPPQETEQGTGVSFTVHYPNGEHSTNTIILGYGLYNPNPPTYIPMAIRKGGSWKDLNTNKGKILIRKSNKWEDKSEENVTTMRDINKGHNRIRRSGNWRQLPSMTGGKADD